MKIFSGEDSEKMWDKINSAKTVRALREALYTVCCRLQEFESIVESLKMKQLDSVKVDEYESVPLLGSDEPWEKWYMS